MEPEWPRKQPASLTLVTVTFVRFSKYSQVAFLDRSLMFELLNNHLYLSADIFLLLPPVSEALMDQEQTVL